MRSDAADGEPPQEMHDHDRDDIEVLRKLSTFGALSHDGLTFLREQCDEVLIPAGDHFFLQGEIGDSIFVLRRGRVAIVRTLNQESMVLAELEPGDCFGEMALVAISPRNASVRALEDCRALRLRNLSLLALYKHNIEQFTLVQMNLGREIARRLAEADAALFEYARRCGETVEDQGLLARSADWLT